MCLGRACETRTGDTPQSKRQRQRRRPPGILMTTPESLALLLSYYDAPQVFGNMKCVAIDALNAFVGPKRSARDELTEEAERCGMQTMTQPWLGGRLTKFRTAKD